MHPGYGRALSRAEVLAVVAAAGVPAGSVRGHLPLDGGTYSSVYAVRTVDRGTLVVKVAPAPDVPQLRYERGILATEALFYRRAAAHVPGLVPEVLHHAPAGTPATGDCLVMTALPGRPWSQVAESPDESPGERPGQAPVEVFGDAEARRLRRDLGRTVAALHRMTGTRFGYPAESVGPLRERWREAFLDMVGAMLDDAVDYGVALPAPADRLRELFGSRAYPLDAVTVPVLTHFDLWDGNILLDPSPVAPPAELRISGLIDGERAFWGDPAADFVSLALDGSITDDRDFIDGYRQAGGPCTFGPDELARLALYRAYLSLLMVVEETPRGYSGPEHAQRRARTSAGLINALSRVQSLPPGPA